MSDQIIIDAFPPPEMVERMENVGAKKANLDFWIMFALAALAGSFIGLGWSSSRSLSPTAAWASA